MVANKNCIVYSQALNNKSLNYTGPLAGRFFFSKHSQPSEPMGSHSWIQLTSDLVLCSRSCRIQGSRGYRGPLTLVLEHSQISASSAHPRTNRAQIPRDNCISKLPKEQNLEVLIAQEKKIITMCVTMGGGGCLVAYGCDRFTTYTNINSLYPTPKTIICQL